MRWTALGAALLCAAAGLVPDVAPTARANNDTHLVGVSETHTLDCNGGTLFVNGVKLVVYAMGTCWAITTQGSECTVIADNVINDITVYGNDMTVYYRNGNPLLFDRGRELGMTNRLARIPA